MRFPQNTTGSRSGLIGEDRALYRQREREMDSSENSLVRSVVDLERDWTTLGFG